MGRLISVILPVYNGEKYLRESIESVLRQTYRDWELILVDDGSTDGTRAIAETYARQDGRIRYEKNPENMKLPRTLNRGFSLARGDYLTWTSDDNLFYPNALDVMVHTLEEAPDVGFVFASCDVIDENGVTVGAWEMKRNMELRKIMGANIVGACFLYTRAVYEQIGDYDPTLFLCEDFDYWQRIFARFRVLPIEETLYAYRDHASSLTNTSRQIELSEITKRTLLKNAAQYQKLDAVQKYFLYEGLERCRSGGAALSGRYRAAYRFYRAAHLLTYRLPRKLSRLLHGG